MNTTGANRMQTPSKKPRRAALATVQPPVLCDRDAGLYIGKSQSWMRQRRFRDIALAKLSKPPEGPAWIQVESSILYRVTDLDAWLASKAIERGQVEWRGRSKSFDADEIAS